MEERGSPDDVVCDNPYQLDMERKIAKMDYNLHGQGDDNSGSMCGCGYRRKKNVSPCRCGSGYPECSKTGPDGAVCTNPYHSQDL